MIGKYYEVVALIGFRERDVEQLNKCQDLILEDNDRILYVLVNRAMYGRGKKFSRSIVGHHIKLVDDIKLAIEIVRLNTPSLL